MNAGGEGSVQCTSCGATVKGPPGAMKCPYCGMRVDIPLSEAQRNAPQLAAETEDERRRAQAHNLYQDASEDAPIAESSNAGTIIGVVVGVGVVVAIIALAVGASHRKSSSSGLDRKKFSTSTTSYTPPTATTTSTFKSKPSADSILIASCRCAFGDGQSTPLVTITPLAAPSQDPSRPLSLQIQSQNGFTTSTGSSQLALPLGTALTPLDGGDLPPHMAVACDTGVYVLVVDRVATGWSSVNAKWKWNATLPASLVDGADAAAPPQLKNTDFGGYCTSLPVTNGNASIALAGGKHATLSLRDGKVK